MKVSSLVYATDQGLGLLAKSFYDHDIVTHPIVVRHGKHPTHDEWYPAAPQIACRPFDNWAVKSYLEGSDVVLFFETPFEWELIPYLRSRGVATAIMAMHECTPATVPHQPDLWLCPSLLDLECFSDYDHQIEKRGAQPGAMYRDAEGRRATFVPVPVEVPWKLRKEAKVFVHNAGHGSFRDRNGTQKVIQAWDMVKSPARLIIRTQRPLGHGFDNSKRGQALSEPLGPITGMRHIEVRTGTFDYDSLWDEGDVFLYPESFNGLSLPLQEARAAGMLVMATNRFPMSTWLPEEPLIPMRAVQPARIASHFRNFMEALIHPEDIAAKIDTWYGRDISDYSLSGKKWAETMSWDVLAPVYAQVLGSLRRVS